jgi:hypothetical protein
MPEITPGRGTSSTAKSNPAGKSARTGAGAAVDGKTSGQRTAASHSGPAQCPAADGIIASAGPARHVMASKRMLTIVPHLLMTRVMLSAIRR